MPFIIPNPGQGLVFFPPFQQAEFLLPFDEDYWTVTSPWVTVQFPFYLFDDEPPAGLLRGAVEDSADVSGIIYPISTAGNLSLYWFDDELPTTLFGQYDEDFWQVSVPVLSAINTSLYWFDDEARPQPGFDEEYWWTTSQQSQLFTYPQPWIGEQGEQATGLYVVYDEDFWQVSNQQSITFTYPQQWTYHDDAVFIHIDDADYWQLWQPQSATTNVYIEWYQDERSFLPLDETDQPVSAQWTQSNVYPQQWIFHDDAIFIHVDDADFWNQVIQSSIQQPLYWFDSADDRYWAPLDETEWYQVVQPVIPSKTIYFFDDADRPFPQYDEDYWQVVTLPQVTNIAPQQWFDQGDMVFVTIDDSDYWQVSTPAWQQNNYYVFSEGDERAIPPVSFVEEDYWQIPGTWATQQRYPQQWDMAQEDGGTDLFSAPRVIPPGIGFTRYMTEADRIEWQDRIIEKNKLPPL